MPKPLAMALVAALGLSACDPPKTVKAVRYTILHADSSMDAVHGGGQWVQEIWFPDQKVACMLVFRHRDLLAGKGAEPRLYAFPSDAPRNHLTGFKDPKPSATEEIEVPAEVAEEIAKLAELTRRWEAETWRLGEAVASKKLLRELPQDHGPR